MQICTNMSLMRTLSGTFNAISGGGGGGGGNVYNVMLHVNTATLKGLTSFILCLIMYSQKIIVCKITPGGGFL